MLTFFYTCNLKTQHGTGGESQPIADIINESGSDDDDHDSVGDGGNDGRITDDLSETGNLSSEGSCDEHDGKGDEITPAKTDMDGVSVSESEDEQSKILRQRTLELGECASDSEDMRDSQVSSGWLGKAYNLASREAKEMASKTKAMEKLAQVRFWFKTVTGHECSITVSNQWGSLAKN